MLHQRMKLYQRVAINDIEGLAFSVSCRLTAKSESDSLFAAAVCLGFIDNIYSVLGETRIYVATRGCDWQNSPRLYLIPALDSFHWYDYHFFLRDVLESLPGVVYKTFWVLASTGVRNEKIDRGEDDETRWVVVPDGTGQFNPTKVIFSP